MSSIKLSLGLNRGLAPMSGDNVKRSGVGERTLIPLLGHS